MVNIIIWTVLSTKKYMEFINCCLIDHFRLASTRPLVEIGVKHSLIQVLQDLYRSFDAVGKIISKYKFRLDLVQCLYI